MKLGSFATVAAAFSLAASPAVAQSVQRAPAPLQQPSNFANDDDDDGGFTGTGLVLALLALAAVIAGIIIAADGDDDTALSP